MTNIQVPTHCPECASELENVNNLLYCRNPQCGSQMQKKIEHFAKTLKIKGLGPASIKKLGLSDVTDIYSLDVTTAAGLLNSQKVAEKLIAEIDNSRKAPLNSVLPAFSIPLIGQSATDKLSSVCKNISDITRDNCEKAGLGPKATNNLMTWLEEDFWCYYDGSLPFSFEFAKPSTPVVKTSKGLVCISGKLKSFKTKAEATKVLESYGYTVKDSLTKEVTILINESGIESSKTQKARESGVTIVQNLTTFLSEI